MKFQVSAIALACTTLLAACGGGSGGGGASGAKAQSVDFPYPGARYMGTAPAPLVANASSGLAVSFTSLTPSSCTVKDGNLVPVAPGECSVTATQAGDGTFAPSSSQQLFKVLKQDQHIAFDTPGDQSLNQAPDQLYAESDRGLPVSFASTTPDVCTVSGSALTLVSKGACAITASQAGDANVDLAKPQMVTFNVVDTLPPRLTFLSGYASTKASTDGGAISTFAGSNFDGWNCVDPNWCGAAVSADGRSFTYHYLFQSKDPKHPNNDGWSNGYFGVEIAGAAPGVQVSTQTKLRFKLGQNKEWYANGSNNGVKVTLTLGHAGLKGGNACNVALSNTFTPAGAAATVHELALSSFAVSESCDLANLNPATELGNYAVTKIKIEATTANVAVADVTAASPTYPTVLTLVGPISLR
jgi:hypothetical protein